MKIELSIEEVKLMYALASTVGQAPATPTASDRETLESVTGVSKAQSVEEQCAKLEDTKAYETKLRVLHGDLMNLIEEQNFVIVRLTEANVRQNELKGQLDALSSTDPATRERRISLANSIRDFGKISEHQAHVRVGLGRRIADVSNRICLIETSLIAALENQKHTN